MARKSSGSGLGVIVIAGVAITWAFDKISKWWDAHGQDAKPLLVIAGICLFLWWVASSIAKIRKNSRIKKVEREAINKALSLINEHAQTLLRKKRQCRTLNDYGVYVINGWDDKISEFVDYCLKVHLGIMSYVVDRMDVKAEIEKAILTIPEPDPLPYSPGMDPLAYEQMCADLLAQNGWSASTTKATGDMGADVIAEKNGVRVVLQCKLYSSPVGTAAVQEVCGAKAHVAAKHAAVVSNASYTSGAKTLANSNGVRLLHHEDLLAWADGLV